MGLIIYVVCLAIQIYLALDVYKRQDVGTMGKLIMILVIVLVPYLLGAAFYYFYGREHLTEWFK